MPWLLVGSVLSTIGTGLIYTLDIGTSSSKWIGYQALAGIGIGFAFQVPMIANQAFVKMDEISSVTAVTLCESLRPVCTPPAIADTSSLPNHRWSILRFGRPNGIRQPSPCSGACDRSWRESCSCGGDGRDATSKCFPRRAHCWDLDCIHGRLEAFLCTRDRTGGCDLAHSDVCEMAEREAKARRCGCMMTHGSIVGRHRLT